MASLREQFLAVFPQFVSEVLYPERNDPNVAKHVEDAIQHLERVLKYNVPGGKLNRGLAVVTTAQCLALDGSLTAKQERQAMALGWCVEFLQAFFLVADDIMDESETRRGQACWYKTEGIGLIAINDSFLIQSMVFRLLKLYFQTEACYTSLLQLFLEVTYQTELGQCLDLLSAPIDRVQLDQFTPQRYQSIVLYKTAFYSFYLPVASALYMMDHGREDCLRTAKDILLPMGEFFQIQDDYLDCFGDPSVTGKVGTDIEDNKCSWLVVQALSTISHDQRKLLQENYGQQDPTCVAHVKQLFKDLQLQQRFYEFEEETFVKLQKLIKEQHVLPTTIFTTFLHKIFKRKK